MALLTLMLALAVTAAPAQTSATETQVASLMQAEPELASKELASGRQDSAIVALEAQRKAEPNDPALLINLGIAYAQQGETDKAQAMFEAALASPDPIELDTADGRSTDSRRLARKALNMLANGEFNSRQDRLTQRK